MMSGEHDSDIESDPEALKAIEKKLSVYRYDDKPLQLSKQEAFTVGYLVWLHRKQVEEKNERANTAHQ